MLTRRTLIATAAAAASSLAPYGRGARAATPWDWWADLLNYRPDAASLNGARAGRFRGAVSYSVQRLEAATGQHLNFDYFPIEIHQMPTTGPTAPLALLAHIRRNLSSFLDRQYSGFRAWSDDDKHDWEHSAEAPLGAIMIFDIPAGGPFHEQAGVVVSASTYSDWVFSPVTLDMFSPGEHPVSGNRQFGIFQPAGRPLTVYTRAVDRVLASTLPGEPTVFAGADNLWKSFQSNVAFYVDSTGGRAAVVPPTVMRPTWADVVASGLWRAP